MNATINEQPSQELIIDGKKIDSEIMQTFGDDRGYFTAINFKKNYKRAYVIKNHKSGVVRAFHGHKKESKTFCVLKGAFKVIVIDMINGNWRYFFITEKGNNSIDVPSNAYNGFVSLTDDSEILILSDATFEESKNDDYRLPYNLLGEKIWEIENR